ncbi:MAG TPA: ATP-binding protein [Trebonia sp.]|nr:ATP-binding protein [Trebonia sp.]
MTSPEVPEGTSMLLAFRAANVRSFRDEIDLSLLATALAEPDVPRLVPWREGGQPIRVLPAAGVFGANASGKSNLLRALDDMRSHVLHSFRQGDPEGGMARSPFRLDRSYADAPSRFEVDLVLDGIRHEYGFVINNDRVLEEWAYRYPRGKAALLFRREEDAVTLGERNRVKGRAVIEILRPNSLFLSAAAAASHPDLLPLHQWFGQNLLLAEASTRAQRWAYTTDLMRQEQRRQPVLGLLHAADLGITDARVRELDPQLIDRVKRAARILQGREDEPDGIDPDVDISEPGVVLTHLGADGDVDFDSAEESLGTMVWLGLAGPVIAALANGEVLLVDEIEASLHPTLVAELVRLFQNPESNPRGAQVIFNSHEASLLGDSRGDRVLGRDQVWFTEKAQDGASRLYPLADLSPRADEAIGRRYLAGRYGATPIVAPQEFTEVGASVVGDSR